jgi:hypothetical protein
MNDYYQVMWHAKTKANQVFIMTELVRSDMLGRIIDVRMNQPDSLGVLSVVPAEMHNFTEEQLKDSDKLHKTLIDRKKD